MVGLWGVGELHGLGVPLERFVGVTDRDGAEEDGFGQVHQGLVDLFLLKTSADKKKWALINPQAVFDYENDKQFALIEAEIGTMVGTGGKSVYLRPSFGVGDDRPYDFSLEAGFKLVW